jgi:hypothetical protein
MTVTSNITNAQLAAQIQALITSWQTRETQMIAWLAGAAGGGDNSNGTYPLSDAFGNVEYVQSPAQMAADVTSTVNSSTAQADAAAASATAASAAQAAAITARNLASTYATNSAASATQAANSQSAAASNAASALAYKNAAGTSATAAAASATAAAASASSMTTAVTDSAASATAAAGSASSAAASAAAAQTWNPANYAALAGATFTGAVTVDGNLSAAGNKLYMGSSRAAIFDEGTGYLILNPSGSYANGVDTPGNLLVGGSLLLSGSSFCAMQSVEAAGAITYGSLALTGSNGGYIGLVLDDSVRNPTFMSNGTSYGVYNQLGTAYWSWLDSGSAFEVTHPVTDTNGHAYYKNIARDSGNITFSTSSPSGGADGDIWFKYPSGGLYANVSGTWEAVAS